MMISYYGQNGVMSEGWDTEAEANAEMQQWYQDDEHEGCYVTELNGKWVIAY